MKLKVYNAVLVEETEGILAISLVDYPAIEKNFMYFSKTPVKQVKLSDKHIITCPILIP